ncbi:MAG: amidohydrolase family protein [Balneolaceae bacterium]
MYLRYFGVLLIILLAVPILAAQHASSDPPLLLQQVHITDVETGEIVRNQTIVIQNGLIEWVGDAANAPVPEQATIINGPFYVLPGMAEMHAHIPSAQQGEQAMEDVLFLFLSQGITTVRGMLGQTAHLELRERAARGDLASPRIITSGPSFSGNSVSSPEQARERVQQQAEAGYDLLKLHPGLSREIFDTIVEEADRVGMEYAGHVSFDVGLPRTLETRQGTIDHLDRYLEYLAGSDGERPEPSIIYFGYSFTDEADPQRISEVAEKTREAGIWNVPTNSLLDHIFNPDVSVDDLLNRPGMEYIATGTAQNWANFVRSIRQQEDYDPQKARRFLELRDALVAELHRSGAGILLGADAPQVFNPPGFSSHHELELLVRAGLSPAEALQTATTNVAQYVGEESSTGRIAPGYRADLVLLSASPLEVIPFHSHIEVVIANGRLFGKEFIEQRLAEIRERTE